MLHVGFTWEGSAMKSICMLDRNGDRFDHLGTRSMGRLFTEEGQRLCDGCGQPINGDLISRPNKELLPVEATALADTIEVSSANIRDVMDRRCSCGHIVDMWVIFNSPPTPTAKYAEFFAEQNKAR